MVGKMKEETGKVKRSLHFYFDPGWGEKVLVVAEENKMNEE